jgi:hypothetical protein
MYLLSQTIKRVSIGVAFDPGDVVLLTRDTDGDWFIKRATDSMRAPVPIPDHQIRAAFNSGWLQPVSGTGQEAPRQPRGTASADQVLAALRKRPGLLAEVLHKGFRIPLAGPWVEHQGKWMRLSPDDRAVATVIAGITEARWTVWFGNGEETGKGTVTRDTGVVDNAKKDADECLIAYGFILHDWSPDG